LKKKIMFSTPNQHPTLWHPPLWETNIFHGTHPFSTRPQFFQPFHQNHNHGFRKRELHLQFEGRIVHVRTQEQAENAMNHLHAHNFHDVLGFDMEWRPERFKTEHNPVALIQLSSSSICLLFHMFELGYMPTALRLALENPHLPKVCHGFEKSDKLRLQREFNVTPLHMIDTSMMAACLGHHKCGLKSLVTHYFHPYDLDKSLAVSDWAAEWLSPEQITYAATDAWITRELYFKLMDSQMGHYRANLLWTPRYLPGSHQPQPKQNAFTSSSVKKHSSGSTSSQSSSSPESAKLTTASTNNKSTVQKDAAATPSFVKKNVTKQEPQSKGGGGGSNLA
jgi:hypothetical protein